ELLARPDRARARTIYIKVRLVVRIDHQRVRVRTAACLDRRDLLGITNVTDVEDADAAETLGADRLLNALDAAVDPAADLLNGHEQQIAVDRHVALPARADDGGQQAR